MKFFLMLAKSTFALEMRDVESLPTKTYNYSILVKMRSTALSEFVGIDNVFNLPHVENGM